MLYNTTVGEIYGTKTKKGLLAGVELEWEFDKGFIVEQPLAVSSIKPDGSLRNYGIELVSKPLGLKELDTLGEDIGLVMTAAEQGKAKFVDTMRTSMHVHLNVSDLTYGYFMNILFLYSILEPYFLSKVHSYRVKNNFASPMGHHKGFRRLILDAITTDRRVVSTEDYKYSAMNLGSLCRFGTLEFRSHETTKDIKVVADWVLDLFRLRQVALEYKTPKEIMRDYQRMTSLEFFSRVFPNHPKVCPALCDSQNNDFLFSAVSQHPDDWDYSKDPRYHKDLSRDYNRKALAQYSRKEIMRVLVDYKNRNLPVVPPQNNMDWGMEPQPDNEPQAQEFQANINRVFRNQLVNNPQLFNVDDFNALAAEENRVAAQPMVNRPANNIQFRRNVFNMDFNHQIRPAPREEENP